MNQTRSLEPSTHPLIQDLRAAVALGRPLLASDVEEIEALLQAQSESSVPKNSTPDWWAQCVADATASLDKRGDRQMASRLIQLHQAMTAVPNPEQEQVLALAASIHHYLRDEHTPLPAEVFSLLPPEAQRALVTIRGLADAPMRIHPRDAKEAATYLTTALLEAGRRQNSHAPVALSAHGIKAVNLCIRDLQGMLDMASDYDMDEIQQQSLRTAIETLELRKCWVAPPTAEA